MLCHRLFPANTSGIERNEVSKKPDSVKSSLERL